MLFESLVRTFGLAFQMYLHAPKLEGVSKLQTLISSPQSIASCVGKLADSLGSQFHCDGSYKILFLKYRGEFLINDYHKCVSKNFTVPSSDNFRALVFSGSVPKNPWPAPGK